MKIILKGIDKGFIDLKSKPKTKFDMLYKNISPKKIMR
jgi:hypothetical protein